MSEKERLKALIEDAKKPNVSEWVYEVESFLEDAKIVNEEAWTLIDGIKLQGEAFQRCDNLIALLRQIYRRQYDRIVVPSTVKENQIFIAMMFSDETNVYFEKVYKPVIQSMNYAVMRIDQKEYTGSIIGEIQAEITDSVALIADLTGNRGGVYYEAGIAKGLQLCNHPIKLVLSCERKFFETERVHFDVSGDNILLYDSVDDLKKKLENRLTAVLKIEDVQ